MKNEFNREKFLKDGCMCGCGRRELLLDKIEAFKETDPEVSQFLTYYRDNMVAADAKIMAYHKLRMELGDKEIEGKAVEALRAMADKLEECGAHFIIYCNLPALPIFSGKDMAESYHSHIEVSMVAAPLGG